MKNSIKQKNGISLIVLVITIIVMIILASAIILSLKSSGIIERANEAKNKSDIANAKEVVALAYAEWELERVNLSDTYDSFSDYAMTKLSNAGFSEEEIAKISVFNDGTLQINPIIPKGFVMSIYEGEQKISDGLVIYKTDEYILKTKTNEEAMITYDQYVWIPVNGEFERIAWNGEDFVNDYIEPLKEGTKYMDDILKYSSEIEQYNSMKASVEKYGGFYIGRYETGKSESNIIAIKKDVNVYTDCWDADFMGSGYGTDTGSTGVARLKATYDNSIRHVIYGVQWDMTLKFIEDSKHNVIDSSSWGNYSNYNGSVAFSKQVEGAGSLQVTGYSEHWKVKNIYDLAGNVEEATYEACDKNFDGSYSNRIWRGGKYENSGIESPASNRYNSNSHHFGGFRVALYLK